jgi:hypothetical protein
VMARGGITCDLVDRCDGLGLAFAVSFIICMEKMRNICLHQNTDFCLSVGLSVRSILWLGVAFIFRFV